jgi:hypothetical protein
VEKPPREVAVEQRETPPLLVACVLFFSSLIFINFSFLIYTTNNTLYTQKISASPKVGHLDLSSTLNFLLRKKKGYMI